MREALAHADHDYVIAEPRRRPRRRGVIADAAARGRRVLDRAARYTSLVAGAALAAVVLGIFINALALQKTRHPAPFFGRTVALPDAPAPQPQPQAQAPAPAPAPRSAVEAAPVPAAADPAPHARAADPAETPARDPIAQLLKVAPPPRPASPPKPEAKALPIKTDAIRAELSKSEPARAEAAKSEPTKAVVAAQRALVKLGFVLRADGVMGASTHQALEQFERDRGLPVHGELTPQVIRELHAQSGIEIE